MRQPLGQPRRLDGGPALLGRCDALLNHPHEFWPYVGAGKVTTAFHRGAQIDARGNLNNSRIAGPRPVRLPGGAGMADTGALVRRILIWSTTHDRRTFVEKVDFVSMPGYLDAAGDRERWGMPGGPALVVTNLAVLDFAPSGRMRLRSVHPGITVADVVERTGFDLELPPTAIPETAPPTERELEIIRAIDPAGYRKTEFRKGVPAVPSGDTDAAEPHGPVFCT